MATISLLWKSGRKLGNNKGFFKDRHNILKDHLLSGALGLEVSADPAPPAQSIPRAGRGQGALSLGCPSQHLP